MHIDGGEGVGRVTKRGLDQPVGNAAINSVPRQMIRENVEEVMALTDSSGGLDVVISAPEGETLAKKTFNPRLGIVGGISILGTTGIVEPMSEAALVETIRVELRRRAMGKEYALLTPGNYGSDFIRQNLDVDLNTAVQVSNFLGDALDICRALGFRGALLVGHVGKLVKTAGGMMNHSKYGDCRMEILAAHAAAAGVDAETSARYSTAPRATTRCASCANAVRTPGARARHGKGALPSFAPRGRHGGRPFDVFKGIRRSGAERKRPGASQKDHGGMKSYGTFCRSRQRRCRSHHGAGAKLLGECDVVIYAGSLVNPALLAYCRKDCRIYNSAEMTLEQVIDAIRKAEAAGETTVRLHTGDSSIFGAVREQFDELDKLGIAYDVCPGVSAFCGAAASLKNGVHAARREPDRHHHPRAGPDAGAGKSSPSRRSPRIRRRWCSSSARASPKSSSASCSWAATPSTPAAVVYKATWPEEKIFRCTVGTLHKTVTENGLTKTSLIIVGECMGDKYLRSLLYHPGFTTEFREATE